MHQERIIQLQQLVAQRNEEAYRELFHHFYPKLLRFSHSVVKALEVAEEIVEDVFVNIWQQGEKLTKVGNLSVYLYVATKNRSLSYLSGKARDIISYFEEYPANLEAAGTSPDHLMMTAELSGRIEQAIRALPPRCKLIFKLVREDGLKYREVGEILNISVNTVDVQMSIAMKKLSRAIYWSPDAATGIGSTGSA